jgi:hypothetical protein
LVTFRNTTPGRSDRSEPLFVGGTSDYHPRRMSGSKAKKIRCDG